MITKPERKIREFELSEEQFDAVVTSKGLAVLESNEEYILYGTHFGADMTYKNYIGADGADAFKLVQFLPEEVTCGKCHIKLHTGYHDNCPICNETLEGLVQKNRDYNDEMADFNATVNAEYRDRMTVFQDGLLEKYGFNF